MVLFLTVLLSQCNPAKQKSTDQYISEIKSEYRGIITEVLDNHGLGLKIKTSKGIIEIYGLIENPVQWFRVNDSIFKNKDENTFNIINNGVLIQGRFIIIPESIKRDPKWPKEWKDY
jgi:hypothetical protein